MIPVELTYGMEGLKEIRDFLKKNYREDYTLSIFDILEGYALEVVCDFENMLDVIAYVVNLEHDFPAWIGINELSESYVVGLNFTRGHISTMSVYEWKNNRPVKVEIL